MGPERLTNVSKATQLISGRANLQSWLPVQWDKICFRVVFCFYFCLSLLVVSSENDSITELNASLLICWAGCGFLMMFHQTWQFYNFVSPFRQFFAYVLWNRIIDYYTNGLQSSKHDLGYNSDLSTTCSCCVGQVCLYEVSFKLEHHQTVEKIQLFNIKPFFMNRIYPYRIFFFVSNEV